MDLADTRQFVADELFRPQQKRHVVAARRWPEPDITGTSTVAGEVVDGIVQDVLAHLGYSRTQSLVDPLSGRTYYGRVEPDGSVTYLRLTWRPASNEVDSGFNPYQDITFMEVPPVDPLYVVGPPFGVPSATPTVGRSRPGAPQ
jgi:hypothetical protein